MPNLNCNKINPTAAALPEFIKNKLMGHEADWIDQRKNGKPLVLGKHPGPNALMLQSNDYLALAKHPTIVKAQVDALQSLDHEVLMSAVFFHEGSSNKLFEQRMAAFVGYENAILSQSGWAANVGLLQVIADENTNVYIDFFTHMSFWEGIKSAKAKATPFRHNDVAHLESLIKKNGPGIIMVDSIYSILGSFTPLIAIANLASQYGCALVVDESHSLGTHGPNGAGLVAALGLQDQVHVITASLAKAFAGRAGMIFCSGKVARCFPFVSHPAIFSSALLCHEIAGLAATLDLVLEADERRKSLYEKSDYLRTHLSALGYHLSSESQIVSLESGTEAQTEILRDALEARDIFGAVFCSPATPKNRALIRFSVHSHLTYQELDKIISVCDEIRDEVGMKEWKSTKRHLKSN